MPGSDGRQEAAEMAPLMLVCARARSSPESSRTGSRHPSHSGVEWVLPPN